MSSVSLSIMWQFVIQFAGVVERICFIRLKKTVKETQSRGSRMNIFEDWS